MILVEYNTELNQPADPSNLSVGSVRRPHCRIGGRGFESHYIVLHVSIHLYEYIVLKLDQCRQSRIMNSASDFQLLTK